MIRPLLKLASPGGSRARLSILVLHRVLGGPDPLYPEAMDAARFSEVCRWVRAMFRVLPLDTAVRRLRDGTLPERALAITFDDGYADNCRVALPILKNLGLPATIFVSTGFLNGGCMWNDIIVEACRLSDCPHLDVADILPQASAVPIPLRSPRERREALEALISAAKYMEVDHRLKVVHSVADRLGVPVPTDLMMTADEVRQLRSGGLQVGAHTVTHPILAELTLELMRREMKDSKDFLEDLLGEPVPLFAYPNGKLGDDYDARAVSLARELGFEAAVTTTRGAASTRTDPYQLPRFTPWDRTAWRFGLRMFGNLWANDIRAVA